MSLRSGRKQRGVDRGFVLSDHADWPALLATIEATQASHIWVMHGRSDVLVRHLTEHGKHAQSLVSAFERDES
jgi:putative mRNA 3-end processing factor